MKTAPDSHTLAPSEILSRLTAKGLRVVDKQELTLLARAEQRRGPIATPNSFHFIDEQAMFRAIDEEKALEAQSAAGSLLSAD